MSGTKQSLVHSNSEIQLRKFLDQISSLGEKYSVCLHSPGSWFPLHHLSFYIKSTICLQLSSSLSLRPASRTLGLQRLFFILYLLSQPRSKLLMSLHVLLLKTLQNPLRIFLGFTALNKSHIHSINKLLGMYFMSIIKRQNFKA